MPKTKWLALNYQKWKNQFLCIQAQLKWFKIVNFCSGVSWIFKNEPNYLRDQSTILASKWYNYDRFVLVKNIFVFFQMHSYSVILLLYIELLVTDSTISMMDSNYCHIQRLKEKRIKRNPRFH